MKYYNLSRQNLKKNFLFTKFDINNFFYLEIIYLVLLFINAICIRWGTENFYKTGFIFYRGSLSLIIALIITLFNEQKNNFMISSNSHRLPFINYRSLKLFFIRLILGGGGLYIQIKFANKVSLPNYVLLTRMVPLFLLIIGAISNSEFKKIKSLIIIIILGFLILILNKFESILLISSLMLSISLFIQTKISLNSNTSNNTLFEIIGPPSLALTILGFTHLKLNFISIIIGFLSSLIMILVYLIYIKLLKKYKKYGVILFSIDMGASLLSAIHNFI